MAGQDEENENSEIGRKARRGEATEERAEAAPTVTQRPLPGPILHRASLRSMNR